MHFLSWQTVFCFISAVLFADIPPEEVRLDRVKYVLSLIKPGAIGAEIGVCQGTFAYHVLLKQNPAKLFLIDPWEYGLQKDLEPDVTPENQKGRSEQYQKVCEYFAPFENVTIIRQKAEDVASQFENEYFDYVYIDGEHSYAAVARDLRNYFPKVKVGGYLIGDDYGWTGIAPAVQDFLKLHRGACLFLEDPYLGRTRGQYAIKRLH